MDLLTTETTHTQIVNVNLCINVIEFLRIRRKKIFVFEGSQCFKSTVFFRYGFKDGSCVTARQSLAVQVQIIVDILRKLNLSILYEFLEMK